MRHRLPILALLIVAGGILQGDEKPKDNPVEKFVISQAEKEVLDLTNQERTKEKLTPLKPHPLLFKAARDHTQNMAKQEKLDHVLDGVKPDERTAKVGYKSGWIGENIAAGQGFLPREVIKTWMESEGHRKNILTPEYVYIGIGAVRNAKGEYYYTQVFGRAPRD